MPEEGLNEVANELLRLSRDRKLSWKQTRRENEYRVSFPDMSFSISNERARGYFQLNMIDESGNVIESLRRQAPIPSSDEVEEVPDLVEIYSLASSYIKEINIQRALDYLKTR